MRSDQSLSKPSSSIACSEAIWDQSCDAALRAQREIKFRHQQHQQHHVHLHQAIGTYDHYHLISKHTPVPKLHPDKALAVSPVSSDWSTHTNLANNLTHSNSRNAPHNPSVYQARAVDIDQHVSVHPAGHLPLHTLQGPGADKLRSLCCAHQPPCLRNPQRVRQCQEVAPECESRRWVPARPAAGVLATAAGHELPATSFGPTPTLVQVTAGRQNPTLGNHTPPTCSEATIPLSYDTPAPAASVQS